MSEWGTFYLEETGRIVTGKTPLTANANNFGGHIPFITPSDLDNRKHIAKTQRYISEQGLQTIKSCFLPRRSVMVSCIGSDMGKIAINAFPSVTNQQINTIIPNENFDADFLYYSLRPRKTELQTLATSGSAQPILNKGHFSRLTINAPPLLEQKAIAMVLGALDDKIELNRQMNTTLEVMARALFKSWFVDFDPLRAKSEGRQPFGMDTATVALFPSRFVPSSRGDIPEGWTAGTLGDVADSPRTVVQPHQMSSEMPYIGLEHMPRRCISLTEWGQANDVTSHKSAFACGDFLFGKLRPYFHKVGIAAIDGIASTDIAVVKAKQKEFYAFVLSVISSDAFVDYTNQLSNGAKMPRINWADMAKYELALPPQKIASAYNAIVAPMLSQIIASVYEGKKLSKLRDYLLPKLISGNIRVRDAEKFVEAA